MRIILYITIKYDTIKEINFVNANLINSFKLKYLYSKNKIMILLELIIIILKILGTIIYNKNVDLSIKM